MSKLPTVDPDKPLRESMSNSVIFNFNDYDTRILSAALLRFSQHLVSAMDQSEGNTVWRQMLYKEVFQDLTATNHEGTGSDNEAAMLDATGVVAAILNLRN